MNYKGLDLNLLVALDALLEEVNVTRSAARLNMSQPAMSAALARLRRRLDDDLVVQVGHKLELTPFAEQMRIPVRDILLRADQLLEQQLEFDVSRSEHEFTVEFSDYCCRFILPELASAMIEQAPGMRLHVRIPSPGSFGPELLDRGEVDLIVLPCEFVSENYGKAWVYSEGWTGLVCQQNSLVGDTVSAEQVDKLPLVEMSFARMNPIRKMLLDLNPETPPARITIQSFSGISHVLQGTSLMVLLPTRLANYLEEIYPLRTVIPEFDVPHIDFCMAWHPRRERDPAHQWLRRVVLDICSRL